MKCVKNARRARDICVFGAGARGEDDDRSDVDILVSSSLTTSLLADNHEIARSTATNDVPKLAAKLRAAIGTRLEWMVPADRFPAADHHRPTASMLDRVPQARRSGSFRIL